MVIFDVVPRDLKVVKQSPTQGNTGGWQSNFLTVEQGRSHGCFNGEPTANQLARYFHLDDLDRAVIEEHRGDHNRLGFGAQLCTARFLGTFLENLSDTPNGVVAFIGQQLGIRNRAAFEDYCQSVTRKAHPVEIRRRYGFRNFSDISARFRLNRSLCAMLDRYRSPGNAF